MGRTAVGSRTAEAIGRLETALLTLGLLLLTGFNEPTSATVPERAGSEPGGIEIRFETPEGRPDLVTVVVIGLEPADSTVDLRPPSEGDRLDPRIWRDILRVVAVEPDFGAVPSDFPSLLGSYSWARDETGAQLRFRPKFPPTPGIELRVTLDQTAWRGLSPDESGADFTARWTVPDLTRAPTTRVEGVFPSGTQGETVVVPSNLLRLYVHFSAPMSAHAVLPHIELLDDSGTAVPVAFVGIPGGLWDPERVRLTLLVHPGRVKRGVGPNQAMGPVLEEGRRYRLRIASQALDADGLPLVEAFEHEMLVGPPDLQPPDPQQWQLDLPKDPQDALRIRLLEPADRALLERLPWIEGPDSRPVSVDSSASVDGLSLTLKPHQDWAPGRHVLVIPPELEDPSGNRPGRRFEEAGQDARGPGEEIRVVFEIRF